MLPASLYWTLAKSYMMQQKAVYSLYFLVVGVLLAVAAAGAGSSDAAGTTATTAGRVSGGGASLVNDSSGRMCTVCRSVDRDGNVLTTPRHVKGVDCIKVNPEQTLSITSGSLSSFQLGEWLAFECGTLLPNDNANDNASVDGSGIGGGSGRSSASRASVVVHQVEWGKIHLVVEDAGAGLHSVRTYLLSDHIIGTDRHIQATKADSKGLEPLETLNLFRSRMSTGDVSQLKAIGIEAAKTGVGAKLLEEVAQQHQQRQEQQQEELKRRAKREEMARLGEL